MSRPTVWMFVFILSATRVSAQTAPPTPVTQPTVQQPVVLHSIVMEGEPLRPGRGWSLSAGAEIPPEAAVTGRGPGIHVGPLADLTVYRPTLPLSGTFTVGAVFQSEQPSAVYGLTLGGEPGVRFLVRNDGAFSISSVAGWSRVALRPPTEDAPGQNHLEVRVEPASVTFAINGQVVQTLPITPGQLDGVPGVHVGATGDVSVAGFMVQTANAVMPEAGR